MVGPDEMATVLARSAAGAALFGGSTVFVLAVGALGLALYGRGSGPAPVDAGRVVEALDDGVIVLDPDERVLDCNRVARRHAAVESPEGNSIGEAFPRVGRLLSRRDADEGAATGAIEEAFFRGAGGGSGSDDAGPEAPSPTVDGARTEGARTDDATTGGATTDRSPDRGAGRVSTVEGSRTDGVVDDVLTVVEDGRTVQYDVRVAPLDDGGDAAGTVVHLAAVTQRVRRERELLERERELRRQNERLDEFASMVSHDLRNPISVATAYLTLAREEGSESAFDEVEAALERMDRLTSDLLAMARQGESVTERRPVSVAGVAEEAWTTADCGGATLSTEDDAVVSADRGRLRQLFENLFRNAHRHGDADEVRVGTVEDGFFVADDGSGVDPAERGRVFDRGYSTDPDGSGYGLAIVEEVARAHGWTVEVTDARDGGARFEVTGVETDPETG